MSIFPLMASETVDTQDEELPVLVELAYDPLNNRLMTKNGKHYYVTGNDALKIWIFKVLKTKRYRYQAFTGSYGQDLESLVSFSNDVDIMQSECRRMITEALMVNPYIQEINNFEFEREGSTLKVEFDVVSIYDKFTYESEVFTS